MEYLGIIGRILGILSIPLLLFTIWGLIRQVRKEQRLRMSTPVIGLVMAPVTLLINLVFLRQAFPAFLGPAMLVMGLGLGLAWGQTNRVYRRGDNLVGKRSIFHLVFWGISYAITQLLATFMPAYVVAGGLAAMFFSTGSTLGTNLNLMVRMLRLPRGAGEQGTGQQAVERPATLPERS